MSKLLMKILTLVPVQFANQEMTIVHMFVGYPSHVYVLYNKFMLYISMASSRLSLEGRRSPCFNP